MRRRHYLEQLLRQRPEWLLGSMAEPTRHMTRTHVLLHAVALRRLRAYANVNPGRDKLRRLGLRRVVAYELLKTPNA